MKKNYLKPDLKFVFVEDILMNAGTALDPTQGDQTVTPSNDEYDGEFGASQVNVWED